MRYGRPYSELAIQAVHCMLGAANSCHAGIFSVLHFNFNAPPIRALQLKQCLWRPKHKHTER